MIVSLSSVRGAPGVSSWTMLLAAAWPTEYRFAGAESTARIGRVVLEADIDGGVFGARYGVGIEPGVSTLISMTRRHADDIDVADVGRVVGEQAWLVPGPETAEGARQLWSGSGIAELVAERAATDDHVWFVDVGRAANGSIVSPFIARSSLSILLTRADHESLVQLPARIANLKAIGADVGVIIVGPPTFELSELGDFFGTPLLWVTPDNENVVALSREVWSNRRVRRSMVWRSALEIANDLSDRVTSQVMRTAEVSSVR